MLASCPSRAANHPFQRGLARRAEHPLTSIEEGHRRIVLGPVAAEIGPHRDDHSRPVPGQRPPASERIRPAGLFLGAG